MVAKQVKTDYGVFQADDCVQLALRYENLKDKTLIQFNKQKSTFDFNQILLQIKNSGIQVYWHRSKYTVNSSGPFRMAAYYSHLVLVDPLDINLIKLLFEDIKIHSLEELYKQILED